MSLEELQRLDREYAIGVYERYPVQFVRGEGARLWDVDGNEYLDFLAGIAVSSVGHCHPAVVEAISEQARTLIHLAGNYYHEPGMRLCERISKLSLGGKVWLTNSGAEAVEAALKLARKNKPRGEIVCLHGAFHGRTFGALSATPQEAKQAPFAPLVPGFVDVPATAEAIAGAVHAGTAAVLLEPIQGESGVHPLSAELLQAVRAACDEHGALLIFDEIQSGVGRTGRFWAYEHTGVEPDLLTTAKAIGGGVPIGALVTTPELGDVLSLGDHGSTFAGAPLACAAALAALDVLDDEQLLARVRELGEYFTEALAEIPGVTTVRGRGLMIAFEIGEGDARELAKRALTEQRLVITATGPSTLRLLPPLIIGRAEADDALGRLRSLLAA